ncbi:hypothetical protein E5A73_13475 [Sphingomonas gei]|uniref:Alginate export domain-containing protein n=1 Tax=Sphingomonas gei TaxID=1395960 RepID=A0A4S1X8W0_9SPHN|nr:alginate export family protein [Sphingomonas gei]TGX52654.1 hypothetical protein E5A73_13475 [Sphingomonas gei]
MRALCLALVASATPAAAQELSLSGTARLRYEAIEGQPRAGSNASDDLVNLRTTLLAEYKDGPVRLVAELWDSRVYGGDRGTPITTGEVNPVELVQAYAEFRAQGLLGAGSTATLQAGRFTLNLGSRRLVAADDYRNTTNGYTGLRADLAWRTGWKAALVYTLPQQRRPDTLEDLRDNKVALDREGFDLVLWGGLVSRTRALGPATLEASFFHLGERDRPGRPTRDRSLDTASLRLLRDPAPGHADYEAEAIVQRGRISASTAATAPRQQVAAWFVHAEAGYTSATGWKPRLSLEYDHASGDRPGGRNTRFDTLFGMRRADLGPSGLYNAFGRANFLSPALRIEAIPGPRTDAMASLRPIWLAAAQDSFSTTGVRDPTGRAGDFAGTQFDARLRHQLTRALKLELDAVLLAKGRFLREAPNAPPGRWTRYGSVNLTAAF